MVRVREFVYTIDVSEEFARSVPDIEYHVVSMLKDAVSETELLGPRGGRYERVGGFHHLGYEFDPARFVRRYAARVMARYVRPKRITA